MDFALCSRRKERGPAFCLRLHRVPPLGSLLKALGEKGASPRLAPAGPSLGPAPGVSARSARPGADCYVGTQGAGPVAGEGDPHRQAAAPVASAETYSGSQQECGVVGVGAVKHRTLGVPPLADRTTMGRLGGKTLRGGGARQESGPLSPRGRRLLLSAGQGGPHAESFPPITCHFAHTQDKPLSHITGGQTAAWRAVGPPAEVGQSRDLDPESLNCGAGLLRAATSALGAASRAWPRMHGARGCVPGRRGLQDHSLSPALEGRGQRGHHDRGGAQGKGGGGGEGCTAAAGGGPSSGPPRPPRHPCGQM